MRKLLRVQVVAAVVLGVVTTGFGVAHAGDSAPTCQHVPVTVPGVTIVGQRVHQVSDVGVCIDAQVGLEIVPKIRHQPQCGDPCFSIELQRAAISEDIKIEITHSRDGEPQAPIEIRPQEADIPVFEGRMCLVGVGTPDPCIDRITDPASPWGEAGRRRVTLGWEASEDTGGAPLAGYEIFRSRTGEAGSYVLVATAQEPTFVDRALRRRSDYFYYVVAFDGDGNRSNPSDIVAVRTR